MGGERNGHSPPQQWNQGGRAPPEGHQRGRESPSNRNQGQHPSQPPPGQQHLPPQYANYPPPPHQQQQQAYAAHPPYPQPPPGQGPPPPPPQQQQQQQHPDMLTLPPPHAHQQDMAYRAHHQGPPPPHQQGPYDPYAQHPQQPQPPMGYAPQSQQSAVTFNQPAPRQRTAIACRYCRRRKIRCHGFDQNLEGRCSNCVRFNQECIFTPVSSQTHAFVPAHTAYPHMRNQGRMPQGQDGRPLYPQGGPPLYGAHGQPLGPAPPPAHSDVHYPPPPGPHQPYGAPAPYPTAPPSYDNRGPPHHPAPPHDDQVSSKRLRIGDDGAYAPLHIGMQLSPLSPPYSESPTSHAAQNRRSSGYDHYPDGNHMAPISPASTTASYPNQQYQGQYYTQAPQAGQSGPAQQPTPSSQHRTSPTSNYSYEQHRESASPHGSVNAGPGTSYGPYPGNLHPPQVLPAGNDGRNASPAGQGRENGRSNGMRVHDMLDNSDSQGGRNTTDSNMLNRLNKRAP